MHQSSAGECAAFGGDFRCLGICFGVGKYVRWLVETVGLQEEISMQQEWFRSVKHMLNTDLILWHGAASSILMTSELVKRADVRGIAIVLVHLAGFIAFDILLRFGVVRKRWLYRRTVQRTVLLPLLVVLIVVPKARWTFSVVYFGLALVLWQVERFLGYITEKQHEWFSQQWESTYKALTLGECPSSDGGLCPCPCTHPQQNAHPRCKKMKTTTRWPPLPRWLRRLLSKRRGCKRSCKRRMRKLGHAASKDSLASDASTASWVVKRTWDLISLYHHCVSWALGTCLNLTIWFIYRCTSSEGISGKNLHTFQKSLQSNFDTSCVQRCRNSAVSHPDICFSGVTVSPAHSEMLGVKTAGCPQLALVWLVPLRKMELLIFPDSFLQETENMPMILSPASRPQD